MLLADQGAEVLEIERPDRESRVEDALLARGKSVASLNLKDPDGQERALSLARSTDIVIDNLGPVRSSVSILILSGCSVPGRVPSHSDPRVSCSDQAGAVQVQCGHSSAPRRGRSDDEASIIRPAKVLVPVLVPRIE
jgi:hypothetical protein